MKSTTNKRQSVTITKADFDNAVVAPWSPDGCLIAQAAIRYGFQHNTAITRYSKKAAAMRHTFDKHFLNPGDERKRRLQRLRQQLPVTLHLSPNLSEEQPAALGKQNSELGLRGGAR